MFVRSFDIAHDDHDDEKINILIRFSYNSVIMSMYS